MRKLLLGFSLSASVTVFSFWGCGGSPPPTAEIHLPEFGAPHAKAFQLGDDPGLMGAMAAGGPGDWILTNERFSVCISGLGRSGPTAPSGGHIVDVAAHSGEDVLREVAATINGIPAVYTELRSDEGDTVGVTLVATGHHPDNADLSLRTTYRVAPGDSRLEVVTEVVNNGYVGVEDLVLGDRIGWGRAEPFFPGEGSGLIGHVSPADWFFGSGGGTGLMYVPQEQVTARHEPGWSHTVSSPGDLAPRARLSFRREWIVAAGGVSDVTLLAGDQTWVPVNLAVTGDHDLPVEACRVAVFNAGGEPVSRGVTGADGVWRGRLPAGELAFDLRHPQRGRLKKSFKVEGGEGRPPGAPEAAWLFKARLPEPAGVSLRAESEGRPAASRWIFEGLEGTPDPWFGPAYRFQGAANVVFAPSGAARVAIPPGKYRVTCVQGLRHDMWQTRVSLGEGDERTLSASLVPLPFQPDWASADLHAHTLSFPDGTVSSTERSAAAKCGGVRWLAAVDGPMDGLSGDGVGPLPGLIVRHAEDEHRIHGGGFERPLDGVELRELLTGRGGERFARNWEGWMAALKDGAEVVGVGNSGSLTLLDGGDVQNLVRVGDPASRDQVLEGLAAGRVQVTNGPLIDFVLEGASPGETVESDGNTFSGHLRVVAGSWVDVSLVEILVNGEMHSEYRIRETERPVRFEEDISIRPVHGGRSFVQVRVTGNKPLYPVATGPGGAPVTPVAFTNPVWVEIPYSIRARSAREGAPSRSD